VRELDLKEIDGVLTPKTICKNCRWHKNTHDGSKAGPGPDADWENVCMEPSLAAKLAIHPVSGKKGYIRRNSLGGIYLTDQKHPDCASVNKGNCAFYQKKISTDVRKIWGRMAAA